eukprot:178018_1
MSSNSIGIQPFYSALYGTFMIFGCLQMVSILQKRCRTSSPYQIQGGHITNTKSNKFIIEKSISKEAYILLKLALQLGFSAICEMCVETVSTSFFGRLSNSSQILSATGLAISFTNLTALCIAFGMCSALWTLIPQAVGSNNTHLVRLYVQRAFVVSFIIELPLALVLIHSTQILQFIGVNKSGDINWNIITNYCYALIPFPYFMFTLSILHRVLQNFNYNTSMLVIQTITFIISIPMNYIFVYMLNFGYIGGAIVYNLIALLNVIIIIFFLIYNGYSFIFKPLPLKQIFDKKGMIQYIKLGFPLFIQKLLQWNIRESVMILTGYINNTAIMGSCTAVMMQMNKVKFLHIGLANATGMRIGAYIGANSIFHAKRCIKIQIAYELMFMIITGFLYTIYRYEIASLFTNNTKVISLIGDKLVYLCLLDQFTASIYIHVSNVYRALGYQNISASVITVTQYLMVFPLQLFLLFGSAFEYAHKEKIGIYVIWLGSSFGYLLAFVVLVVRLVFYIDWNTALEYSKSRIHINNENMSKKKK